jgi:hypothetical protein
MTTRRLAAILTATISGYSRLMGVDEEGTLAQLQALRSEVFGNLRVQRCAPRSEMMTDSCGLPRWFRTFLALHPAPSI